MRKSMLVAVLLGTALAIPSTMTVAADAVPGVSHDTMRFVHDATDPYCSTGGKCEHRGWWHEEHHRHMHHHRHHKKKM